MNSPIKRELLLSIFYSLFYFIKNNSESYYMINIAIYFNNQNEILHISCQIEFPCNALMIF